MERYCKHTLLILVTKELNCFSWVYCYKELQGPTWYKQYLIIHYNIILSFELLNFMRVHIIVKSDYYLPRICVSGCPSVRVEKLGYHQTDFHEI